MKRREFIAGLARRDCVAARGAGAAASGAGGGISRLAVEVRPEHLDRRFCPAHARACVDRRSYGGDRVSLGRGTRERSPKSPPSSSGSRSTSSSLREPSGHRGKEGDLDHSHRLRYGGGSVANGLVANLARPGGNVTGLSNQSADIAGKRIELCGRLSRASAGWRSWPISPFRSVR